MRGGLATGVDGQSQQHDVVGDYDLSSHDTDDCGLFQNRVHTVVHTNWWWSTFTSTEGEKFLQIKRKTFVVLGPTLKGAIFWFETLQSSCIHHQPPPGTSNPEVFSPLKAFKQLLDVLALSCDGMRTLHMISSFSITIQLEPTVVEKKKTPVTRIKGVIWYYKLRWHVKSFKAVLSVSPSSARAYARNFSFWALNWHVYNYDNFFTDVPLKFSNQLLRHHSHFAPFCQAGWWINGKAFISSRSNVFCQMFLSVKAYGSYMINKIILGCLKIRYFSPRVSLQFATFTREISSWTLEEKFHFNVRPCITRFIASTLLRFSISSHRLWSSWGSGSPRW